jgi:hypothetical protein
VKTVRFVPRGSHVGFFLGLLAVARAEPSFFQARVAPIFDRQCSGCHGETKQKGKLRLDSYASVMAGGEDGAVIKPGAAAASEMIRRVKLPREDEEAMPSDGKPALSADEIKILELWIEAGASDTMLLSAFPGAPVPQAPPPPVIPLAPDWRPFAQKISALEGQLGLRLAPRSQIPTDGLVLRTASAPTRCDDGALSALAPVADLIVDAELARTRVTDHGLAALAACVNLRTLDLTHTTVTSAGVASLAPLQKLEAINLTSTSVDAHALDVLKSMPALKKVWAFGTAADGAGSR